MSRTALFLLEEPLSGDWNELHSTLTLGLYSLQKKDNAFAALSFFVWGTDRLSWIFNVFVPYHFQKWKKWPPSTRCPDLKTQRKRTPAITHVCMCNLYDCNAQSTRLPEQPLLETNLSMWCLVTCAWERLIWQLCWKTRLFMRTVLIALIYLNQTAAVCT